MIENQRYYKLRKHIEKRFLDKGIFFNARGSRIRTHDLRFWRPLFYQLNYTPIFDVTRFATNVISCDASRT